MIPIAETKKAAARGGASAALSQVAASAMAILIDNRRILGRGAVANVYPIVSEGNRGEVAKIYHDPAKLDRARIEAMLAKPPQPLVTRIGGDEYAKYAWPTRIIEHGGVAIGFAMPGIDESRALTLDFFFDRTLLADRGMKHGLPLGFKLDIARNLALVLADLHAHRHFVIDFKPQNIKVYRETHLVAMLDCDSYCIRGAGDRSFPATNYSSEYIAPEALRERARPGSLGEDQDRFALAVVIFKLLNNGIHPFQGIVGDGVECPTNDDKVRRGLYPHGAVPNPAIDPVPFSIHRCFDDDTRAMFDRAFGSRPAERPSPAEWGRHIGAILSTKALAPCPAHPQDESHIRFAGKACGACFLQGTLRRVGVPKPRKLIRKHEDDFAMWKVAALFAGVTAFLVLAVMIGKGGESERAGGVTGGAWSATPPPALAPAPADDPAAVERNLNLDAGTLKSVQRALTLLSFDTHGVDGAIGARTRRAIESYQASRGLVRSGYLDASQVERITREASEFSSANGVEIEICNRTPQTISAALGYKANGVWLASGWWTLKPRKCAVPGVDHLLAGVIYGYASTDPQGGGSTWLPGEEREAVEFCVDVWKAFNYPDSYCAQAGAPADYRTVRFGVLYRGKPGKFSWTIGP